MTDTHYEQINSLVEEAQSGSADAVAELLQFYQPLIRAAIRRCMAKEPRLASYREDLEAEMYLVLHELLQQYHTSRSLFTYYLKTRLDHAILQHSRKWLGQNPAGRGIEETYIEEMPNGWEPEYDDDPFDRAHRETILAEAVAKLKPEHRDVIELYFYQSRNQMEAATELEISQGSFSKRLNRALAEMRKLLPEDFLVL